MAKLEDLPDLLARQDWEAATKVLKREAEKKSASAEVFYNLAKVLEQDDKWQQAGQHLQIAIQKRPDYQIAWFELGRWYLDQYKLSEGLAAFSRARELDPNDQDAVLNVGRLALRLGKWQLAEECFSHFESHEAKQALYRTSAEKRETTHEQANELLAIPEIRPEVLKTLTRVSKGKIPLKL